MSRKNARKIYRVCCIRKQIHSFHDLKEKTNFLIRDCSELSAFGQYPKIYAKIFNKIFGHDYFLLHESIKNPRYFLIDQASENTDPGTVHLH